MKKWISYWLIVILCITGIPCTAEAMQSKEALPAVEAVQNAEEAQVAPESSEEIQEIFYIPDGEPSKSGYQRYYLADKAGNPVDFSSASPISAFSAPGAASIEIPADLPASYDGRTTENANGKVTVTSVKNQGGMGLCWAYTFLSCVESEALMKTNVETDYSERHLGWFSKRTENSDVTDSANEPTEDLYTEEQYIWRYGGNWQMAAATLARGSGLELDENFAFSNLWGYTGYGIEDTQRYNSYATIKNVVNIVNEDNEDGSKNDLVKAAIMQHGCVGTSICAATKYDDTEAVTDSNGFLSDYSAGSGATYCYNYQGPAYNLNSNGTKTWLPDHGVSIIGWDDNFSKTNFNSNYQPENDGAWLVKNSWGTGFGDGGYLWISYEDKLAATFDVYYVELDDGIDGLDYDNKYQYDGKPMYSASTQSAANVFTAKGNENLNAIMFYVFRGDASYTFSVYTQKDGMEMTMPSDGEAVPEATTNFTADYAGWYTIDLAQSVQLKEGQKFAITVQGHGTSFIAREYGTSSVYTYSPGQTYYYNEGTWVDLSEGSYGNIALKALTVNRTSESDSDGTNDGSETTGTDDGGDKKPGTDDGTDDGGDKKPGTDDGGDKKPGTDDGGDKKPGTDDGGDKKPGTDDGGDKKPGTDDGGDKKPGTDDEDNTKKTGIWAEAIADQTYTGAAIKVLPAVYDGEDLLTLNKDYTLKYQNNKAAGVATVIITGKGNYKGKYEVKFHIVPKDITTEGETLYGVLKSGKTVVVKPTVTTELNGKTKKLSAKDYTATYNYAKGDTYEEAKAYSVTVTGKGNYTGSITYPTVFVTNKSMLMKNAKITLAYKSVDCDGTAKEPAVVVRAGGKEAAPESYSVAYTNNVYAGKATVTVTGDNKNLFGSKSVTFTIKGAALKKVAEMTGLTEGVDYTGKAQEPDFKVVLKADGKELTGGTDYEVTYKNNVKAGKATVIVEGKGAYEGKLTKTFRIHKVALGTEDVRNDATAVYTKAGAKATNVVVTSGGNVLVPGMDYKVSYKNNKKVGSATLTVTGMGGYSGKVTKDYTVVAADFAENVMVNAADAVTGTRYGKLKVTVTDNGKKLSGSEYSIEYYVDDAKVTDLNAVVERGKLVTAVVISTGGNYVEGSKAEDTLYVGAVNLSKAKVKVAPQVYTGEEVCPIPVEVKVGRDTLTLGEDYIITGYGNNINKSNKATITIQGIDDYCGSRTVTFKIAERNVAENWIKELISRFF